MIWAIPARAVPSNCVTLGKSLPLSEPIFLQSNKKQGSLPSHPGNLRDDQEGHPPDKCESAADRLGGGLEPVGWGRKQPEEGAEQRVEEEGDRMAGILTS